MQIVIELTSDQVEALESFLTTQTDQVPNAITGNVMLKPKHKGVEDFLLSQVGTIVSNAMQMYPPASAQEDVEAIKAAQQRIANMSKPTLAEKK
jgi:16S rRNA G1207 methylase RsmC